jgi:hypothetical protein
MTTRQLLRQVGPGLLRRDLYYLESQGLVTPTKYRSGRVFRRDWPESLVSVLRRYVLLKEDGLRIRVAWERAQGGMP